MICDCRYCTTGRKLRAITNKLEDSEDKNFLINFLYNYVPSIEEDLDMTKFMLEELKNAKP